MKPYYEDDHATIYHGDAIDVLPHIDAAVGTIVTDPPYASGGRNASATRANYTERAHSAEWFMGDNMGTDTYIWWLRQLGSRLFQMATPGAHCYCFTDWRQYPNVVTALESVRWTLSSCVVWDKARGGAMGSFWRNNHELVPVFTKGSPTPLPDGSYFNVLAATKPQGGVHPTVKPLDVIARLISAGRWVVLDPFLGSGTTLLAAKQSGRRAIGVEVEEEYCEIAAKRLAETFALVPADQAPQEPPPALDLGAA